MATAATSATRAHPDTSTIFVLGLLSFGFFPFGAAAWWFGAPMPAHWSR